MKTSIHRIYTEDGLELSGALYQPEEKTKKVLAFIPGMAGDFYSHKFLDVLVEKMTDNNIAFCPFNNRGTGYISYLYRKTSNGFKLVKSGAAEEKFEECILDIKAHLDFLENQGFSEIYLQGYSLGAPKVVYYQVKTKDKRIKSLILLSPPDMLRLVREDEKRFKEDIETAEKMIDEGKGNDLMPRYLWDEYPIPAHTYINLFRDDSEAAIFNFYNPEKGFKILSQVSCPIFTIIGRKDDILVIPIEDIIRMIKKEAKSSPRCEHVILGDASHNYRGYEKQLAEATLNWIETFK